MKTFEEFLVEYERRVRADTINRYPVDHILFNLFMAFRKEIGEMLFDDPAYFMKAFRQIDVIQNHDGGGYVDGAIWLCLDNAKIFWEMYTELFTKDTDDDEK